VPPAKLKTSCAGRREPPVTVALSLRYWFPILIVGELVYYGRQSSTAAGVVTPARHVVHWPLLPKM